MIKDQRVKLTKSNFITGKSPLAFSTTNIDTHTPMHGGYQSPAKRLAMRDANNATNFINKNDGSFELMIPARRLGTIPNKNTGDTTAKVNEMIIDLKGSHFTLGREAGARSAVNGAYGLDLSAHTPSKTPHPKGHGLQTHFSLGQDRPIHRSEAVNSYRGPIVYKDYTEGDEIKARMQADAVNIGGPCRSLSKDTTN